VVTIKREFIADQNKPSSLEQIVSLIRTDIKMVREGSNYHRNCGYLAKYVLELIPYYYGQGEKPKAPLDESSADISTRMNIHINHISKRIENIDLVRSDQGLNSISPAADVGEYIDLVSDIEYENASYIDINEVIKTAAIANNGIICGVVSMLPLDSTSAVTSSLSTKSRVGHVIAFIANKDSVYYIDGQKYNGITRQGEPIFQNLDMSYQFECGSSVFKKQKTFQERCFYLPHSVIKKDECLALYARPSQGKTSSNLISSIDTNSHFVLIKTNMSTDKVVDLLKGTNPWNVVLLEDDLSFDMIQLVLNSIKPDVELMLHPDMPLNLLVSILPLLRKGMTLKLFSKIGVDFAKVIGLFLPKGINLVIPQKLSAECLVTLSLYLDFVNIVIPSGISLELLKSFAMSLNPSVNLYIESDVSYSEAMVLTSFLRAVKKVNLFAEVSVDTAVGSALGLQKNSILLLNQGAELLTILACVRSLKSERSIMFHHLVSIAMVKRALKALRYKAGLQLNPLSSVSFVSEVAENMLTDRVVYISSNMSVAQVEAVASNLSLGANLCIKYSEGSIDMLNTAALVLKPGACIWDIDFEKHCYESVAMRLQTGTILKLDSRRDLADIMIISSQIGSGVTLCLQSTAKKFLPAYIVAAFYLKEGAIFRLSHRASLEIIIAVASSLKKGTILQLDNKMPSSFLSEILLKRGDGVIVMYLGRKYTPNVQIRAAATAVSNHDPQIIGYREVSPASVADQSVVSFWKRQFDEVSSADTSCDNFQVECEDANKRKSPRL
jgi:hypothetical protein